MRPNYSRFKSLYDMRIDWRLIEEEPTGFRAYTIVAVQRVSILIVYYYN